ncbi:hypothetical protein MNBD_GAMMA18-1737 [hydrothermal vent metagenome]|uniref:Lipoprotein n=1 Tax=hydrothermal vent metagenome TaxID=652676 RepID=A0A3B0ZAP9_9ZZZZ
MKLLFLAIVFVLAQGCTSTPDRLHSLDISLIGYEKALRWGHEDSLVGFMVSRQTIDLELIKRYNQVDIGGYNTLGRTISEDLNRAELTVAIDYIDKESMRVRKLVDKQVWVYDDEVGRWLLASTLPAFM